MQTFDELSVDEFAAAVDGAQEIRGQQILHLALAAGPAFFCIVVAVLTYAATDGPGEITAESRELVDVLSAAHALVLVVGFAMGFVLHRRILSADNLRDKMSRPMPSPMGQLEDPARIFLMLSMQAALLRLATLEGPALFGLVVVLLAGLNGILVDQPIYWLNAGSLVVLVLWIAGNWPSAARMVDVFRARKEEVAAFGV